MLAVGESVNLDFTTGSAVDGDFIVQTVADANTFTTTAAASATNSGNVTVKPISDLTPDKHFGFIELLRTENGRQYGINVNIPANTPIISPNSKPKKISAMA